LILSVEMTMLIVVKRRVEDAGLAIS